MGSTETKTMAQKEQPFDYSHTEKLVAAVLHLSSSEFGSGYLNYLKEVNGSDIHFHAVYQHHLHEFIRQALDSETENSEIPARDEYKRPTFREILADPELFEQKRKNIEQNMTYCGSNVGEVKCINKWCNFRQDVHRFCGSIMCTEPKCIRKRSARARKRVIGYSDPIKNMVSMIFTIAYKEVSINSREDVIAIRNKLHKLFDFLLEEYGISKIIVNKDVIKKEHGNWHLHFNTISDFPDALYEKLTDRNEFSKFQFIVRSKWGYRINIKPKRTEPQRKTTISYFVKRTVQMNPSSKTTGDNPITLSEYLILFYKTHFLYTWHFDKHDIEYADLTSNLVLSRNIMDPPFTDKPKLCPKCSSSLLFSLGYGGDYTTPPPDDTYQPIFSLKKSVFDNRNAKLQIFLGDDVN